MSRTKGIAAYSANYEPQISAPLDARVIVSTYEELTSAGTWTAQDDIIYFYDGMVATVHSDTNTDLNGMYYLKGDYTIASN